MIAMKPSQQTFQEYFTTLAPADVLGQAKRFFSTRNPLYTTFIDREGPGWASFRGQGNEEIVIAADAVEGGSRVTGSSYLYTMQLRRFFTTLPVLDRPAEVA